MAVEGKAIAALGRALMGTLLLGALKGDSETVQVWHGLNFSLQSFHLVVYLNTVWDFL